MLAMVAAIILVIVLIGIAFFLITKMMGGGRELANVSDAGATNIARNALTDPKKSALSFENPDIASNFAVLIGQPNDINLLNYNKLVAHSVLVALLAKDENTIDSAKNAKRLFMALNEIGSFLRNKLADEQYMGKYFVDMANMNNTKMLGKNQINLSKYDVGYLKRGSATNIAIDEKVLQAAEVESDFPTVEQNGIARKKYFAGYKPVSVFLPASGETLTFVGVPLGPSDKTHLIDNTKFLNESKDDVAVGMGNPPFPSKTVPPNAFQAQGSTRESQTKMLTGALASAIVGSLEHGSKLGMPYGYIEIKNGPAAPAPAGNLALQGKDIFCHALAGEGIFITGTEPRDYFCTGNEATTTKSLDLSEGMTPQQLEQLLDTYNDDSLYTSSEVKRVVREAKDLNGNWNTDNANWWHRLNDEGKQILKANNYIDQWYYYNRIKNELLRAILWRLNIPDRSASLKVIRHRDGRELNGVRALLQIDRKHEKLIFWHSYKIDTQPSDPERLMLDAFKRGYQQFGSQDSGHINSSQFTSLESFKANVLAQRTGCENCAYVPAPATKSGIKYFDHDKKYPSPTNDWNFGEVRTPYEYLEMIDKNPGGNSCALGSVTDKLVKRCQIMKPDVTKNQVLDLLKTQKLALGASLYLYVKNDELKISSVAPDWAVPNTRGDGTGSVSTLNCGAPYDVIGKLVNVSSEPPNGPVKKLSANPRQDPHTDGYFPGWAWRHSPEAKCTDSASFVPSSGFNHLLGQLDFGNQCSGGGQFCEPN